MATLPPPYSQRDAARAQRYYRRSLRPPPSSARWC